MHVNISPALRHRLALLGSAAALLIGTMVVPIDASATAAAPPGDWEQMGADIDGEAAGDASGTSVAMNGDGTTIVVGAPYNGSFGGGHARVLDWDSTGWVQRGADIDGTFPDGFSGRSVAISDDGDTIAIGAPSAPGGSTTAGEVRVLDWDGTTWVERGRRAGEAIDDQFGHSVAMSDDGDTIVVGAVLNGGAGTRAGHARIYDWDGTVWTQRGADLDGEAAGDLSGWSVAMSADGNSVIIGAPLNGGAGDAAGQARIYDWNGTAWTQRGADLDGEAEGDVSGWSVAMSSDGDTVIVGAPQNDGSAFSGGHVRIYDWDGTAWAQRGADLDGGAPADQSGWSVAMSSDGITVIIGAPQRADSPDSGGYARIYDWDGTAWVRRGAVLVGEAPGDQSGWSGAMSSDGDTVVVGAPGHDGLGDDAGHVRVHRFATPNADPTLAVDQALVSAVEGAGATNTGTIGDADGDAVTLSSSVGSVTDDGDGTWSWSWSALDGPDDSRSVTITADDGNGGIDETSFELTVANVAPEVTVSTSSLDVSYSDPIPTVTISATDVDADIVGATVTLPADAGTIPGGLGFTGSGGAGGGSWTLAGIADLAPGTHTAAVTVSDEDGGSTTVDVALNVAAEDAEVSFADSNPVAVPVAADGGTSGNFSIDVTLTDADVDYPGDIDRATVAATLVPVAPGTPLDGTCTTVDAGRSTCSFGSVPVNSYTVEVTAGGFSTGSGEDVLVVFDPSLGFTTGGGSYIDPGSGDKVNFGYTTKYNKNRTNIQGALVIIRHTPDGVYRLKSNQLAGLAIGSATGFSWASFTGKATYVEPGWDAPIGNYEFVAYAEDRGTPGAGVDGLWISAQRSGEPASGLSLIGPATTGAVTLEGGDISVPG